MTRSSRSRTTRPTTSATRRRTAPRTSWGSRYACSLRSRATRPPGNGCRVVSASERIETLVEQAGHEHVRREPGEVSYALALADQLDRDAGSLLNGDHEAALR